MTQIAFQLIYFFEFLDNSDSYLINTPKQIKVNFIQKLIYYEANIEPIYIKSKQYVTFMFFVVATSNILIIKSVNFNLLNMKTKLTQVISCNRNPIQKS